jgi:hypothetical protein
VLIRPPIGNRMTSHSLLSEVHFENIKLRPGGVIREEQMHSPSFLVVTLNHNLIIRLFVHITFIGVEVEQ